MRSFEKKEAKNGVTYFVLKAANGEVIGKSERYKTDKSGDKGIASVQKNAPECKVVDLTEAAFSLRRRLRIRFAFVLYIVTDCLKANDFHDLQV